MEHGEMYTKTSRKTIHIILDGMIRGKRPPERLRNTLIGQIKKDAGVGRALQRND